MRRGRPQHQASVPQSQPKPSPSPLRTSGDPFAALDARADPVMSADDLSKRFPTLDQFSLLHESGNKFEFDQPATTRAPTEQISQQVTMALADEAFATVPPAPISRQQSPESSPERAPPVMRRIEAFETDKQRPQEWRPSSRRAESPRMPIEQPKPQRPAMVSQGTMTSPSASPKPPHDDFSRPIHRFLPSAAPPRSLSQPRVPEKQLPLRPTVSHTKRSSYLGQSVATPKSPASSRPSLEGRRPSAMELDDSTRSKSASARQRPSSVHVESNLDFLRDRESSRKSMDISRGPLQDQYRDGGLPPAVMDDDDAVLESTNLASDMDFLRAKEDEERRKDKRHSSGSRHIKRGSIPSISLSGTKNLLAGRFGEAFRKFESSEPEQRLGSDVDRIGQLSPIAGSVTTDHSHEHEEALDETEDVSPEIRRELERRRLSQEEKRVEQAAAEYRARLASGAHQKGGGLNRAATIQNKVQSLLKENNKPQVKTATGYGQYTSADLLPQQQASDAPRLSELPRTSNPVSVLRKPLPAAPLTSSQTVGRPPPDLAMSKTRLAPPAQPASAPPTQNPTQRTGQKPAAPPKPKNLQTGGSFDAPTSPAVAPGLALSSPTAEDWEETFSKRYPSLSGLEMVETEVGKPRGVVKAQVKEV